MPKIKWSEKFSVNHEKIDGQHKRWIEIFNTAHDRMLNVKLKNLSTLGVDAICEIIDYTDMHFDFEEKYMEDIGFPELAEHRQMHDLFRTELRRVKKDFDNGIKRLNNEIIKMIYNWLMDHILIEDHKYKTFIQPK